MTVFLSVKRAGEAPQSLVMCFVSMTRWRLTHAAKRFRSRPSLAWGFGEIEVRSRVRDVAASDTNQI